MRVTDAKTQANVAGAAFSNPANGWMNNWNADGTMFWVFGRGGVLIPFRFDATTMTASRIAKAGDATGGLSLTISGPFSYVRPNIMYATVGRTIVEYDFATGTTTKVFDANAAVPGVSSNAYTPSVSDDDTKLCLTFGGTQGSFPYVAVLDRTTGKYHVLDTMKSKIDGVAANKALGYGIYTANIDRSGRFVIIKDGSSRPATAWTVWDVQAARVYAMTTQSTGVDGTGFGTRVNQSGYQGSFSEELEWVSRSLTEANITNTDYLVNPANLPSPHRSIYEGRLSWHNAQPNMMVPAIATVVRDARQATLPWRAWDDEIIGIATDGSGTVYRFAHHRSRWDTNANDIPRGAVSPDGRFFLFMSNWERTLGKDPSGAYRQDMFIVELDKGAQDNTAPTVAITAPVSGTAATGLVSVKANASDASGIAGVQFKIDGVNAGTEVKTAPYSVSWDTTTATKGSHILTAVARDTMGNTATSAGITVSTSTTDSTAPTVAITAPANNSSVSGSTTITASASDNVGVSGVQFLLDGAALGAEDTAAPYSVIWNTSSAAAGAHRVTAVARDAAGNRTTSAAVTLNVADTVAPSVSISSPAAGGTLAGTATISASASDNVKVAGVQFLLNGGPLGAEVTVSPFALAWNTTSAANGSYSISARARDAAGNTKTSTAVSVAVNNTVSVPAPAAPALSSPANGATQVSTGSALSWQASANATSYEVHLGTTAPPPVVTTTSSTSYTPGSLFAGTTYYWYVVARNSAGQGASATWNFTTAPQSTGGTVPSGSSLSYTSPYCGPSGGSASWACGAWPTTTPPAIGAPGTVVRDPDTGNRVMRTTQSGSFGESANLPFKVFDGGWKPAWNADDTRFLVVPWNVTIVKNSAYWLGFNGASMSLTGASGPIPAGMSDFQWDQTDPDLIVGMVSGVAKSYDVVTKTYTTIFDPKSVSWGGNPWLSAWGGDTVCIAGGPQDVGKKIACHNRNTNTSQVIDLGAQTINGARFTVYFQGKPVTLPSSVGNHTITMAPDGRWLAIDTHGNSLCSVPGLTNYASTAIFIDLQTKTGYEWNIGCGSTHWAYGYNSAMMQNASSKWTSTSNNGPCNGDGRGVIRRNTDSTIDSSVTAVQPCTFFTSPKWNVETHLSWTNNVNDTNVNKYPVLVATANAGSGGGFLSGDIAALETSTGGYQAKMWRFAQTWNSQISQQCSFLTYSSPSISHNGKWALFPSDWRGQTGSNGICANGRRTDVFLFELK